MKIKFYCDSGANIHSQREEVIDLGEDWALTVEEWNNMSEKDKYLMAEEWAWGSGLDIGWVEVE